jgi:DNA-binding transcriptional LysR family regulator
MDPGCRLAFSYAIPVALVWRRERHAPPAARTFIDFVRRETALAG